MADEKIFLSYSSDDKDLAEAFYDLLKLAGFDAPGEGNFYDQRSLTNGERFTDRILDQLNVAQSVVTLVTPTARQKTAVVAEMAIALATNKLRPVAVPSEYKERASWPFHLLEYSPADKPDKIEAFLTSLADGLGRTLAVTPAIAKACTAFAQKAGAKQYQPPDKRIAKLAFWGGIAAVVVLACAVTYFVSVAVQQSLLPVQLVVTPEQPQQFKTDSIRLVYSGTFPARILSERLDEVRKKMSPNDQTVVLPVHDMFTRAFDEARKQGRFPHKPALEKSLKEIAATWTGTVSVPQPDEKGDCALTETVDKKWCGAIRDPAVGADWKTRLDNTEFAVARIQTNGKWGDQFPVTVGSVVTLAGATFRVANIGRMTTKKDDVSGMGGILHLAEQKE